MPTKSSFLLARTIQLPTPPQVVSAALELNGRKVTPNKSETLPVQTTASNKILSLAKTITPTALALLFSAYTFSSFYRPSLHENHRIDDFQQLDYNTDLSLNNGLNWLPNLNVFLSITACVLMIARHLSTKRPPTKPIAEIDSEETSSCTTAAAAKVLVVESAPPVAAQSTSPESIEQPTAPSEYATACASASLVGSDQSQSLPAPLDEKAADKVEPYNVFRKVSCAEGTKHFYSFKGKVVAGILIKNDGSCQLFNSFDENKEKKTTFYPLGWFEEKVIHISATCEEITFPNGLKYSGALYMGVPQGIGTLFFPDGTEYFGYFACGSMIIPASENDPWYLAQFPNQYKLVRADGYMQMGIFSDSVLENGIIIDALRFNLAKYARFQFNPVVDDFFAVTNGTVEDNDQNYRLVTRSGSSCRLWSGQYAFGTAHGEGTLKDSGLVYQGCLYFGRYMGRGKLESSYGAFYEGEFRGSKYHGEGTLISCDGNTTTTGTFKNGSIFNGKKTQFIEEICRVYQNGICSSTIHVKNPLLVDIDGEIAARARSLQKLDSPPDHPPSPTRKTVHFAQIVGTPV